MAFFKKNYGIIERLTITATSGGSLALANNSRTYQQFTGTTTHTVVLPQANSGCPVSLEFTILNRSTGAITVNYFGGSLAKTIAANSQSTLRLVDNSTSDGVWDITNETSSGGGTVSLTAAEKLGALAALGNELYADSQTTTTQIKVNPEEIGGNYWTTKSPIAVGVGQPTAFSLNGFTYLAGGYNGSIAVGTVYAYSDDNNYHLVRQSLTDTKRYQSSSNSFGGFGYVNGGTDGVSQFTATHEKYTDSTNTWSTRTALTNSRRSHVSFVTSLAFYTAQGITPGSTYLNILEQFNDTANAWYIRSPSITASRDPGFFSLKSGYVVGGSNGSSLSGNQQFNEGTNSWTSKANIPSATDQAASFSSLNMGYIVGGNAGGTVSTVRSYNPDVDLWSVVAPIPSAQLGMGGTSTNGFGYSIGGNGQSTVTISYTPVSFFQISISKKTASVPTSIFVAAALNDVAVSVPVRLRTDGGDWKYFEANKDGSFKQGETLANKFVPTGLPYAAFSSAGSVGAAWAYNVTADTWTQKASMGTVAGDANHFNLSGLGYKAGGVPAGGGNATTANEVYDDIKNTWTAKAPMTTGMRSGVGMALNGFGYQISGTTVGGTANNVQQKYNPTANSWASIANLNTATYLGGAGYLLGFGYVTGGATASGTPVSNNQRYSDVTNTWTNKTGNSISTYNQGSFNLNGKTYLLCGNGAGNTAASEAYNPQTDTWASIANCTNSGTGNQSPTFVVGGLGYIQYVGATANNQKYSPEANVWTSLSSSLFGTIDQGGGAGFQPGQYYNYELQVGLPTYLAAVGGGQWVSKAAMTTGTGYGNGASIGSSMFTIAGFSTTSGGNRDSIVQKYDLLTDSWLRETPYPISVSGNGFCSISTTIGGQAFTAAGDNGSYFANTYLFNADAHNFLSRANKGTATTFGVSSSLNGFGYYASGVVGSGAQLILERFDTSLNSWSTRATMLNQHSDACGGPLNGFLYAVGSAVGGTSANDQYNDAANTWLARALTISASADRAIHNSSGRMMLSSATGNNMEFYSDSLNTWTSLGAFPFGAQSGSHCASINNNGIMAGGNNPAYATTTYVYAPAIKNIVLGAGLRIS